MGALFSIFEINYSKLKALSAYNGQNNNGQKNQRIAVPGD